MEDVVIRTNPNPLGSDLDHVLERTGRLWEDLRGARLFVTGGTGFFGCWLLETILWANDRLGLEASIVVLTRDPAAFARKAPHLAAHPAVALHAGAVNTVEFPDGAFSHVIHAAADTVVPVSPGDRRRVFETIVDGTRRTLEFALRAGASRFLLTSTGAVYGRQPSRLTHVPEEYAGGPDSTNLLLAGAEAKRAAEMLCAVYADARLQPTIARCFAFVGPYLPLDGHLALGNFIRDGLEGRPIRVSGDGTPYRSYLYGSDLAIWLWSILLRARPLRAYNVGSEIEISIRDLAHAVARRFSPVPAVLVARPTDVEAPVERYVPSTERIRTELGVTMGVPLDDALTRTVDWYRERGATSHVAG